MRQRVLLPGLVGLGLASMIPLMADEGMWLFNAPPREQVRTRHGVDLDDAWLGRLMRSSVRFNSGGSGSFVSADGMVISNHHVGADAIHKLSTADKDLMVEGFLAAGLEEERPCLDLELNVLVSIEDVTEAVNAAVPEGTPPNEAFAARRRVMADIEAASLKETGLRSDVVTLFQGGAYHLYRFKRYTDVRLVFAPEQQIAYFGGDADNFEYPRYCLDFCLFRVYEDGKPAETPDFLKWSKSGPADGEVTFVSGHPGRTSRLLTVAELESVRNVKLPQRLARLKQLEVLLSAWSARHPENARRAKDDLFGVQNARKAFDGSLGGLLDPSFFDRLLVREKAFRTWMEDQPEMAEAREAWGKIESAERELMGIYEKHRLFEGPVGFASQLFGIARTLLRWADESERPSGERLREFGEAGRPSLELELFSEQAIHEDLEILKLTDSLSYFATTLGVDDPWVARVLDGSSPARRAAALVRGTRVGDVAVRRKLYEGGADVVREAADPMIELARMIDGEARELRRLDENLTEVKRQAHGVLARARWKHEGDATYPDATFTLRLAVGVVKGYEEAGTEIPAWTVYSGLHERGQLMGFQGGFALPPKWKNAQDVIKPGTPVNFISTHDIIGGNSGSPVVNRKGEFVGIIFDGNLHSLVFDFAYEDRYARAVSVHSSFILESLRHIYKADSIVAELVDGRRVSR